MAFILLKRVERYKNLKYYNSQVAQDGHMNKPIENGTSFVTSKGKSIVQLPVAPVE
jgi:hypothetical protein